MFPWNKKCKLITYTDWIVTILSVKMTDKRKKVQYTLCWEYRQSPRPFDMICSWQMNQRELFGYGNSQYVWHKSEIFFRRISCQLYCTYIPWSHPLVCKLLFEITSCSSWAKDYHHTEAASSAVSTSGHSAFWRPSCWSTGGVLCKDSMDFSNDIKAMQVKYISWQVRMVGS